MNPTPPNLRQYFLLAMGLAQPLQGCGPTDADGDGVVSEKDCDDQNPAVHPSAPELCDRIDNNCDGVVDADAIDRSSWYVDSDSDGYGDPAQVTLACEAPKGSVVDNTDCAPDQPTTHPNADELLTDRVDNDCDGMIDEMVCPESLVVTSAKDVRSSNGKQPLAFCVDRPEDDSACPAPKDIAGNRLVRQVVGSAQATALPNDGLTKAYWFVNDPICGPGEGHTESCCYVFRVQEVHKGVLSGISSRLNGGDKAILSVGESRSVHGRPLTIDGLARLASTHESSEWSTSIDLDPSKLSTAQRTHVAQGWLEAALFEHASVASFARFAMELMALGAPPELVLAATRAQGDEVVHARECFSMASCFAGRPLGPGAFTLDGAMDRQVTPQSVLVDTIVEACVNETLAAAEAAWLCEQTEVEVIRTLHQQISEDESRHAALGWKTVQWLLHHHPELNEVARRTFAQAGASIPSTEMPVEDDDWLAAYGCMPDAQRNALRERVWANVITPCAEALLNTPHA